jgi:hypothetical protein
MLLMSAPFSHNDDILEPCSRANQINTASLRRERAALHDLTGDVVRMLEGRRAGDNGFTGAGTRLTLAAALNALESFIQRVREVEAEMMPVQPLPVSKPFGRRPVPDSRLPAVASVGSL